MLLPTVGMISVLSSCGDDTNDTPTVPLTLNEAAISVNYNKTFELKASKNNVSWTSNNDFVAIVNTNGMVTGNHVGEAIITASSGNERVTCKVTVMPIDNTYIMPLKEWGASPTDIKDTMSEQFSNMELISEEEDDILTLT